MNVSFSFDTRAPFGSTRARSMREHPFNPWGGRIHEESFLQRPNPRKEASSSQQKTTHKTVKGCHCKDPLNDITMSLVQASHGYAQVAHVRDNATGEGGKVPNVVLFTMDVLLKRVCSIIYALIEALFFVN